MNRLFRILFILSINLSFAQKIYNIENVSWSYEPPKDYIYKIDNFSETSKLGEKILENQDNLNLNPEQNILFSIAKDENSIYNVIACSYLSNDNFKKFGNELYGNKLVTIFQKMFEDLKIEATVSKEKITIDNITFYVIKSDIIKPKRYKNYLFFSEIGNKELQITLIFDNEIDEELMMQSILNSKFK